MPNPREYTTNSQCVVCEVSGDNAVHWLKLFRGRAPGVTAGSGNLGVAGTATRGTRRLEEIPTQVDRQWKPVENVRSDLFFIEMNNFECKVADVLRLSLGFIRNCRRIFSFLFNRESAPKPVRLSELNLHILDTAWHYRN